jgi:peroxiredoxin Q/BCP
MADVQVGDAAPDFKLPTAGGGEVALPDLKGKAIILYFYPKADTSACTQEAIDFTQRKEAFESAGAVVIGVSGDPVKALDKFTGKYELDVTLASAEQALFEAYGVWVEKLMYGKKYMGLERSTFLIDRAGKVAKIWRKVKVAGHADEVLAAAQAV